MMKENENEEFELDVEGGRRSDDFHVVKWTFHGVKRDYRSLILVY